MADEVGSSNLESGHSTTSDESITSSQATVDPAALLEKVDSFLKYFQSEADRSLPCLDLLDTLTAQLSKEVSANLVLLFGWNEEKAEWFFLSSFGMQNNFRQKGILPRAWQSLPTIVFQAGTPLFSEELAKDRRFIGQMIRGLDIACFAGTTLCEANKRVGSICIGFNAAHALTDENRAFFLSFSERLGPILSGLDLKGVTTPMESAPPIPVPNEKVDITPNSEITITPIEIPAPNPTNQAVVEETPVHTVVFSQEKEKKVPIQEVKPEIKTQLAQALLPEEINLSVEKQEEGASPEPVVKKTERESAFSRNKTARNPRTKEGEQKRVQAKAAEWPEKDDTPVGSDTKFKLLESFFAALPSVFSGEDFSKEILRKAVAAIGCDSGYLLQFNSDSQRLFPIASEGIFLEIVKRFEQSGVKADALFAKTLDKRQPFSIAYPDWHSPLKKRLCGELSLQSVMMISLYTKSGVWGVLSLFHRTASFSQRDMRSLEFIGEKIGFLYDTLSHWNALSKKMERMAIVKQLGQSAVKGGSVVIACLLNSIKATLCASNCYLLLLDEKKNLLYGVAASDDATEGISEVEMSLSENGMIPLSAKQNHYMVVENTLSDMQVSKRWTDHFRSRSLLSVPLCAQDRVVGVLLIDETAYFRAFTQEEIDVVLELAPFAAVSIEMAIKYQEALQRQERQERLSTAIFQTEDQARKQTSDALGNGTGLLLSTVRKQIKNAGEMLSSEQTEIRKQLEDAALKLDKLTLELEKLSSDLYPNQLTTQGLMPTLRTAVESFSKSSGVSVQINAPSAIKAISHRVEMHLYRIVQEALQNIGQHAQAKSATISVEKKDIYIQLSITDQGKGFDAKRYFVQPQNKRIGIGLLGMKGRVELLGGTFFIESEQARGTRISIKVPLSKKD
ncbi:MAG: GAF domain-containing protein [Nitrospirota bacterium]